MPALHRIVYTPLKSCQKDGLLLPRCILCFRLRLVSKRHSDNCWDKSICQLRKTASQYIFISHFAFGHFRNHVLSNRFSMLLEFRSVSTSRDGTRHIRKMSPSMSWTIPYVISSSLAISLRLVWRFVNTIYFTFLTFSLVFDVDKADYPPLYGHV